MKKILIIIILIFITGCANKNQNKLTCTITQNVSDNITKQSVISTFSDGKASKIEFSIETKLSDKYADYVDSFVEEITNKFSNYQDKKGIDIKTKKSEQSIIFEMNIDVSLLDDESKQTLEIIDIDSNYSTTKKSLESVGYLCK